MFQAKVETKINRLDREELPRKSVNNDSNYRKSYTSLQNTISEPTERNHTETGVGKFSGSRSHKSNMNLLQSSNRQREEEYE